MRRDPAIEAIWATGRYFGTSKPSARVTVNRTWTLQEVDSSAPWAGRGGRRNPMRTWATGADVNLPIQLVKVIQISRSMDSDVATMTLTLTNAHPTDGPAKDKQGMLSQRRTIGGAAPAQSPPQWPHLSGDDASWGDVSGGDTNHAYGMIAQGNMIKTYQGYGVHQVITGVWIIDTVDYNARGDITVNCRDLASLLTDQNLYPPLLPVGSYPTNFYSASWNQDENGDPEGTPPTSTNYDDLSDIVSVIAAWSGFCTPDGAGVLGGIETTGIDMPSPLLADKFDKRPPIDAIKELRDIVGYTTFVDQEGGFRFSRGNQWKAGNLIDGQHTSAVFDITENLGLLEYVATGSKKVDRSAIIAAEQDPYRRGADPTDPKPRYASFNTNTPSTKNQLHGMKRIAILPVTKRIPFKEMVTLAELTGLRSWFQRRLGKITIPGLPLIDIDDQVRVFERVTFDHFLHHVNAVDSTQNLETGEYTMTLSTHWMGADNSGWEIMVDGAGHVYYNTVPGRVPPDTVGAYSPTPEWEG